MMGVHVGACLIVTNQHNGRGSSQQLQRSVFSTLSVMEGISLLKNWTIDFTYVSKKHAYWDYGASSQ